MEREEMRAILAKLDDFERALIRVKCEDCAGKVYLSEPIKYKLSEAEQEQLIEVMEDPLECEKILELLQ